MAGWPVIRANQVVPALQQRHTLRGRLPLFFGYRPGGRLIVVVPLGGRGSCDNRE